MKVDKSKWKKLQLKDIGKVISGATPRTDNPANWEGGSLNWVTPAELNGTKYYGETLKKITVEAALHSNVTLMPSGTVLLSSRAPIGKVAITTVPMYCNQGFKNVVCDKSVIFNEFLYYYLLSSNEELNRRGSGATFKEISKKIVETFPIIVPSLEEQRGIVAELDRIQGMIDGYKAQIADLDALAQSIFLDTFGDPVTNPKGWKIQSLKDCSELIANGSTSKNPYVEKGVIYYRIQNVWKNKFVMDDVAYIDEVTNQMMKSSILKHNDLIITRIGRRFTENTSLGRTALYTGNDNAANISGNLCLVRLKKAFNPTFILYILISDQFRDLIRNISIGAIDKCQLPLYRIEKMPIVCPPLALQELFATRVKAIEELKEKLRAQLADCELLMAERMQYYFS